MNKITKNELFKTGIKLAFAVLAFWFLSKKLDYEQLPELFFSMSYPLLFVALIFQFLSTFISGYRWKLVMDSLGFDKGFWFYQGLYFKGSFFSQALPGSVGGDAIRLIALKDEGYKISDSLYGIFIDRVVGLTGLLIISLIALLFAPTYLHDGIKYAVFMISAGGLAGFLGLLFLHKIGVFENLGRLSFLHTLSTKFYAVYKGVEKSTKQVFLSVAIHFFSILAVYMISVSSNLGIEFGAFLYFSAMAIVFKKFLLSFLFL